MAAPMVVPRPVVSESMARSSGSRSVVGATASCANPENRTSPILVLGVLGLHEVAHRGLRRGEPVGLDVGGAHGARHVERQDHRGLRDRDVHADLRARRRQRRAAPSAPSSSANGHVPPPGRPPRAPPPGSARRWSSAPPAGAGAGAARRKRRPAAARRAGESRASGQLNPMATPPARTRPATGRRPRAAAPRPRPRTAAVSSMCSVCTVHSSVDRVVDRGQRLLVGRREVPAVGPGGDLAQQRLVQRGRDLEAVDLQHRALRPAQPDRVDPHARARRRCSATSSGSGPSVFSPSESRIDRGRAVVARGPAPAARRPACRSRRASTGLPDDGARARSAGRCASAVPPSGGAGRSRRARAGPVGGRLLGDQPAPAERHDAHPDGRPAAAARTCAPRPSRPRSGSARGPRRPCSPTRRRRGSPCPRGAAAAPSPPAGPARSTAAPARPAAAPGGRCRRHPDDRGPARPGRARRARRAAPPGARSSRRYHSTSSGTAGERRAASRARRGSSRAPRAVIAAACAAGRSGTAPAPGPRRWTR